MNQETQYVLDQLKALIEIPSPSGFTHAAVDHLMDVLTGLGYAPQQTAKGGVLVDLGGPADDHGQGALLLTAHLDTLGGMVAAIKETGRLQLTPIGGLQPNNIEGENCQVFTRFGGTYTGTFQLENASVHVNKDYAAKARTFETMEVVLDEVVTCAEDVRALGIEAGDFVCFDPRFTVTESGYIKSRFLDDKLSAAILLGFAKAVREGLPLSRRVWLHFTVYEEVGHGAAASIPAEVTELLVVDMGCVGKPLQCDERMVSICVKDSHGPSDYEMTTALAAAARAHQLDFALDVYPQYGSDADAALAAGWDLRHALIGAGVYASHGYERSHVHGLENTLALIKAFLEPEEVHHHSHNGM